MGAGRGRFRPAARGVLRSRPYWVTEPQNGQTRYSGGISFPQVGQGFKPPAGAGAAGVVGALVPLAAGGGVGGRDGAAPPEGGAARFRMAGRGAGSADAGPAGGAVMPARAVP